MKTEVLDVCDAEELSRLDASFADEAWTKEQFVSEIESGLSSVLAFKDASGVLAYAVMRQVLDEAEILKVFVKEELRRRGMGRLLIEAVLLGSAQRGCTVVHLEVRESNLPARQFYSSLGFVNSGKRRNFYKNPSEDGILMRKMLIK